MSKTAPSIIKRRAARLAFVQYLYQSKLEAAPPSVAAYCADIALRLQQDALASLAGAEQEDPTAEPDFKFLTKLLEGFLPEQAAVQRRLTEQMEKGRAFHRVSPLVQALLESAGYELLFYPETSEKIILDEYVSLAAEFFDNPELGFINGTLHELTRSARPER
jgi:N utilization substance protein B